MGAHSASFAETFLSPAEPHDLIVLDYNVTRFLKSDASDSHKVAGLFFLGISICHEMAHILEFRSVRSGLLKSDGEPHATPPGITCREAGTAWESRVFAGRFYPICEIENSRFNLRGVCVRSVLWNYDVMKADENWVHSLFSENHWLTNSNPLQMPISVYARNYFFEDALLDEGIFARDEGLKSEGRELLFSGSPRRRPMPTTICGGKKVRR